MACQIRLLGAEDVSQYIAVRMRALGEHPEAFATSVAEEAERSRAEIARRISPRPEHVTLGAFSGDRLVGIATLTRSTKPKRRHRATLVAMYVTPESSGRGIGRALLDRVLSAAREWGVSDVSLAVTVGNDAARTLYMRAGFVGYGTEPRSLYVDGRFFDVEWMNLELAAGTGVLPVPDP